MYSPNAQTMATETGPEPMLAATPSQIMMLAPAPAQLPPAVAPTPLQSEKDSRSRANTVSALEITYRCLLLLRTFFFFVIIYQSGSALFHGFYFVETPNVLMLWFLHEAFRLYPGLFMTGALERRSSGNNSLTAFIVLYLIYGVLLIVLSWRLWSATSSSQEGLPDPNRLSSAKIWLGVNAFLLVAEVLADLFGLAVIIDYNKAYKNHYSYDYDVGHDYGHNRRRQSSDGPLDTLIIIEILVSILSIVYQGYCLHIVSKFKRELEPQFGIYGGGLPGGFMMMLGQGQGQMINPGFTVVQPQAYQTTWNPNLQPQQQQLFQIQIPISQPPQQIALQNNAFW